MRLRPVTTHTRATLSEHTFFLLGILLLAGCAPRHTGPWNMAEIKQTPAADWTPIEENGPPGFTYYLPGDNFSNVATGNADASRIEAVNYSPMGDFGDVSSRDFDGDGDVDADDFDLLEACFTGPNVPIDTATQPQCRPCDLDHDLDLDGADYALFQICMSGENIPAAPTCVGTAPVQGSLAMHGLIVDVIPGNATVPDKVLLYARARHYDPNHGRWLQRDPLGHVDGPNLYEAFGGNPLQYTDPMGKWYGLVFSSEEKGNGTEVYWEDQGWFGSGRRFSVGEYHKGNDGQEVLMYHGMVNNDPLDPDFYVLPFDVVKRWAEAKLDRRGYEQLVRLHGTPFRRKADGSSEMLQRNPLDAFGTAAVIEQDKAFAQIRPLQNWMSTPLGDRALTIALTQADPLTESNVTDKQVRGWIANGVAIGVQYGLLRKAVGEPLFSFQPKYASGEAQRLVHLTDSMHAAKIDATGILRGDIYAGPLSNAGRNGMAITWRTGLLPSSYEAAVPIPQAATGAFSKPVPIGPFTVFQRLQGVQYTPRGVLDLGTGTFTRTGVNWTQVGWYGVDVGLDAISVGSAGYWLYLNNQAQGAGQ